MLATTQPGAFAGQAPPTQGVLPRDRNVRWADYVADTPGVS